MQPSEVAILNLLDRVKTLEKEVGIIMSERERRLEKEREANESFRREYL